MVSRSSLALRALIAGALAAAPGCAARSTAPTAPATPTPTEPDGPAVTPPPVGATPAPTGDASASRREQRRAIFVAAWTLVRDKHFDRSLGGLDWAALRARYEPLAVDAPDEPTFYRFLNQMLRELGQSHLEVSGPGSEARPKSEELPPLGTDAVGDPGITVRVIEDRPTIS